MDDEQRCPVCGGECRSHPHAGPLPRCLGGEGIDAPDTEASPVPGRRRHKRGPVEDRAVHGPREDR